MSTSLLYHAFGVRGYRHVRTWYEHGGIVFVVEQEPDQLRCPACGSPEVIRRGSCTRRFRSLPIGRRPVWIELPVQRVQCRRCGAVQQVKIGFADRRRCYTHIFERYVLTLCQVMTIQDVAELLGVGWDLVKDMHKRNLWRRFRWPSLRNLRYMAIDEICVGRPGRFLTLVLNLDNGVVIFVGQGRSKESLAPFWKRLGMLARWVKAVAMDMATAYHMAVLENVPDAEVVFDRFHVVKLFNEKLSILRRQLQNAAQAQGQQVLKGTRWLLLKNPENLDADKDEPARLKEALALNEPLAKAYYLKEDLRQFWDQPNGRRANSFLNRWIARAEASKITMLKKFGQFLEAYRFGLLTWYQHRISTGPLEGINNKIKTLQRQAYGYRDQLYFKLRIYSLHQTKYALVG